MTDIAEEPFASQQPPELGCIFPPDTRYAMAQFKMERLAAIVTHTLLKHGVVEEFLEGTIFSVVYPCIDLDRLITFDYPSLKLKFVEEGVTGGLRTALVAREVPIEGGVIGVKSDFEDESLRRAHIMTRYFKLEDLEDLED